MGVIKNFHTEKERDNEYLEIMTDKGKRIRLYRYSKDIEKQVIEEEKDVNGNMKRKNRS